MSGVTKAIGKFFKKVADTVTKVVPAVLAIGATVFTAGAALGLAPMAGGWGAAVASGAQSFGLTGTLGSVVTGAVTQAGYGAALGGVVSAASGGSFMDGAAGGAVAGAVGGGLMAGMGYGTDILGTSARSTALPASSTALGNSGGIYSSMPIAPGVSAANAATSGVLPAATAAPVAPTSTLGSFLQSPVVGQTIAGIGQGLMQGLSAKSAEDSARARMEQEFAQRDKEREELRASYRMPGLRTFGPVDDATQRPTPEEQFGRGIEYDPQTGRIIAS